jgi:hypothetical protein
MSQANTPKGNYPWAKTPGYFPKVLEWYLQDAP